MISLPRVSCNHYEWFVLWLLSEECRLRCSVKYIPLSNLRIRNSTSISRNPAIDRRSDRGRAETRGWEPETHGDIWGQDQRADGWGVGKVIIISMKKVTIKNILIKIKDFSIFVLPWILVWIYAMILYVWEFLYQYKNEIIYLGSILAFALSTY